jgi:hypothetical protein
VATLHPLSTHRVRKSKPPVEVYGKVGYGFPGCKAVASG